MLVQVRAYDLRMLLRPPLVLQVDGASASPPGIAWELARGGQHWHLRLSQSRILDKPSSVTPSGCRFQEATTGVARPSLFQPCVSHFTQRSALTAAHGTKLPQSPADMVLNTFLLRCALRARHGYLPCCAVSVAEKEREAAVC